MRFTSPLVVDGALNYEHRLYAVAPHMHYLGKNMVARVERRDVTAPFCGFGDVSPLIGCLQKNCADAEDLDGCVDQNCSAEYNGMPTLCNECVTYEVTTSGDAEAAFGKCLSPPIFTAPEQPSGECLFEAPHHDFNWQRLFQYDAPIEELSVVRLGDVLSFECTYDNTLQNAAVAEALQYMGLGAPIGVLPGETTLDEMCLLVVQTLYKPHPAK